ncbi:hypothetical protein JTE90_018205 [Oedothorax gibbosus]|uniref:Uncharacterized protein n=1 Tax=Oedothorax gibbosus TaxID=931172 RepID=A0AAV6U924_9ARAC|nr:hypothetical protein JTE90_018205 [Oedothorax gibbosus]
MRPGYGPEALFDNKGDGFHWICRTPDHTCKRSIRKDTWMEGSHLPSMTIIRLNYEWIRRVPAQGVLDDLGLAKQTVTDWFSFCREAKFFPPEKLQQSVGKFLSGLAGLPQ